MDVLMQRESLEFTTSDLLHVYCIVHPRRDLETQMYTGNHYLRLQNPQQPQTRLVINAPNKDLYINDFVWILGYLEFRDDDLGFFRSPDIGVMFLLDSVAGIDRDLNAMSQQSNAKGLSTSSSRLNPSKSFKLNDEKTDEEAVPTISALVQIPATEPILVLNSHSKFVDDLGFPTIVLITEDLIEHSFNLSGGTNTNSEEPGRGSVECVVIPIHQQTEEDVPCGRAFLPKEGEIGWQLVGPLNLVDVPKLWNPKFTTVELGLQVTNVDTSKDCETCLALGNSIMLPRYMADLAVEASEEFKDLMIMQGVQVCLSAQLPSMPVTRPRLLLAQMNKALQDLAELRKVATSEMFERVFNRGYNHAGDSYEK
ncbi:hypothetical protein Acr_00g0089630 [Actinidia rufa]|uniref:Uncharacterized protein n=1 Tax=Actinidia rufa TaxID=165716 RepID=A0A7J0DWX8_9ERIC|nr:hypothetical protein Acr_00g0089630 [Actinidia rufa]